MPDHPSAPDPSPLTTCIVVFNTFQQISLASLIYVVSNLSRGTVPASLKQAVIQNQTHEAESGS